MALNPEPDVPGWKRAEYRDLQAALVDIRYMEPKLAEAAERAFDEGWPVSIVIHAARRAWAQNTPGSFDVILSNHVRDAFEILREKLGDG